MRSKPSPNGTTIGWKLTTPHYAGRQRQGRFRWEQVYARQGYLCWSRKVPGEFRNLKIRELPSTSPTPERLPWSTRDLRPSTRASI